MGVTPDDVRRLAELAALRLGDAEVRSLLEDLNAILEHVDALQEADLGAVEPPGTSGVAPLRPDRPDPDRMAAGPGAGAPDWQDGFFTVPRLASHEAKADDRGPGAGS